ncbi:MAG: TonB-dependent receptor, partial [Gammaproteobacteria bacterium]|nr:TonB-dependent receptor [Gammaproteobacteria bacterium]
MLQELFFAKTLVLVLTLAVSISQASAEETRRFTVLEEIIVTAQKRSENTIDVPISITSISGDELAARGITDTSQLSKVVPGFIYQTSTFGSPIYYIRGVGFAETTQAVSPAVSVYVDQIPIPVSTMARGAILDLQGLEALKGPQGTLFGQNATGGAINYIAAKPTDEFTSGLELDYGRFNALHIGGFVSGALGETLRARLSARSETRGDWQESSSRSDELGERDFTVARLLLEWEPSEFLRFGVNINGWQDKSDSQANQFLGFRFGVPCPGPGLQAACDALVAQPLSQENPRDADWTPDRNYAADDEYFQSSVRADWDLTGNMTISSLSSYSDYSSVAPFDTDGMAYKDLTVIGDVDIDAFSQELRIAGELDNGITWMVGGNYQQVDSSEVQ